MCFLPCQLQMQELQEEQQEQYGQPERPLSPVQHTNDSSSACDQASADAAAATNTGTAARPGAADSSRAVQGAGSLATSVGQAVSSSTAACAEQETCQDGLQQQNSDARAGNKSTTSSSSALQSAADLDFEAEEMSYWERQVLARSIQLMTAAVAVLRAFGRVLLQGKSLVAGGEALDGWESCVWHSRHLQRAVEDLGAAQYHPQVRTA